MKPTSTLKEILKPPFTHCKSTVGDIMCRTIEGLRRLANVRGWGFFQYFENGEALQDEFKDFLVEALNEKWERDYGEPLLWVEYIENYIFIVECPKCREEFMLLHGGPTFDQLNFCPSCGVRLLAPDFGSATKRGL